MASIAENGHLRILHLCPKEKKKRRRKGAHGHRIPFGRHRGQSTYTTSVRMQGGGKAPFPVERKMGGLLAGEIWNGWAQLESKRGQKNLYENKRIDTEKRTSRAGKPINRGGTKGRIKAYRTVAVGKKASRSGGGAWNEPGELKTRL